ncbi:hypothetical protein ACOMHN_013592 [Nucella lapillus]
MFLQDQDINILATSLLQVPVSFIKPVGSLLLATPSMDPPSVLAAEARDESPDAGVQLCAESAPEGMITSPATPVTTLPSDSYSVLSCQFTPTHVVLHPPTPFSGATEPSSTELKELMLNSSPVRTKCKKLRRRTLCFAQRQNKTPKCQLNLHKLQFKEMKDNIDELTISQDDMKVTFASLIEDAKTATALPPVQLWATLPPFQMWVVIPPVQLWVTLPPAHLWVTLLPVWLRVDLPPAQLWVALLPVQLWMALLPAQLWMTLLPVQLFVALSPVQLFAKLT